MPVNNLLTPQQVAERLNISVQWVYKSPELRRIAMKVGKYLRYRREDLMAYEESRKAVRMDPFSDKLYATSTTTRHQKRSLTRDIA